MLLNVRLNNNNIDLARAKSEAPINKFVISIKQSTCTWKANQAEIFPFDKFALQNLANKSAGV